ncbi:MAG: hypothetical protein E7396_07630 [Ruminococcaceae bacterium]|nr:hypothetical protein [Oscillospiraceae bacterium]
MKKLLSLALVMIMIVSSLFSFTIVANAEVTQATSSTPLGTVGKDDYKLVQVIQGESGIPATGSWTKESGGNNPGMAVSYEAYADEFPAPDSSLGEGYYKWDIKAAIDADLAKADDDTTKLGLQFANFTETGGRFRANNSDASENYEIGATYRMRTWVYVANPSVSTATLARICLEPAVTSGTNHAGNFTGYRYIPYNKWVRMETIFKNDASALGDAKGPAAGIRFITTKYQSAVPCTILMDDMTIEKYVGDSSVTSGYHAVNDFEAVYAVNSEYGQSATTYDVGKAISNTSYTNYPQQIDYYKPSYQVPSSETDKTTDDIAYSAMVRSFGGSITGTYFVCGGFRSHSGINSLRVDLTKTRTSNANGGAKLNNIFGGELDADDVGRKFEVSAYVYMPSAKINTTIADTTTPKKDYTIIKTEFGGADAHPYYASTATSGGVEVGGYSNTTGKLFESANRQFGIQAESFQVPFDTWTKISTTFEMKSDYVGVNDAGLPKMVNAMRINTVGAGKDGIPAMDSFFIDDVEVREMMQYTITAQANSDALGTVSGGGKIWEDGETTLTATANETSKFIGWYLNDELVSEEEIITVSNPTADATYVARFRVDANRGDVTADGFKTIYFYGNEDDDTACNFNTFAYIMTSGESKNTNGLNSKLTYAAANIDAPSQAEGALEEDFGKGVFKIDAFNVAKKGVADTEEGALLSTVGTRFYGLSRTTVPMTSGKYYRVSFWANYVESKYDESDTAKGSFIWTTGNGGTNKATDNSQAKSDYFVLRKNEWQKVSLIFQANDNDVIANNGIKLDFSNYTTASGTDYITGVYLDNFRIEEYVGTPDSVPANYKWDWSFDDVKAGVFTTAQNNHFYTAGEPGGYTLNYTDFDKTISGNKHAAVANWGEGRGDAQVEASGITRTGTGALMQVSNSKPMTSKMTGGVRIPNLFHAPLTKEDVGRTFRISAWVYAPSDSAYTDKYYASSTEETPSVDNPVTDKGTATKFALGLGGIPPHNGTDNKTIASDYRNCNLCKVEKDVPYDTWTEFEIYWTVTEDEIAGAMDSTGKYTVIDALRIDQSADGVGSTVPFMMKYYVDDICVEELGTNIRVEVATEGDNLVGTASVFSSSVESPMNITLILVSYDESGKMIKMVASTPKSFSIGSTFPVVTDQVTLPKNGYTYYAFVWDDLDMGNPYMKPIDITNK